MRGLTCTYLKKCVYAFLEDEIDRFAKAVSAKQVASFVSATKTYPVYVMEHQGEDICLAQAPVGSAPAAQFMDWLIGYGGEENYFLRKLWRLGGLGRKCLS